jgi:hypothetical protein
MVELAIAHLDAVNAIDVDLVVVAAIRADVGDGI